MSEEAELVPLQDAGRVPAGEGWYILNAKDAPWFVNGGAATCTFGDDDKWPGFGVNLRRLEPGAAWGLYHDENDQEGFLVLSGEATLIVEGRERALGAWDYFHCPARTGHIIVGAGDGPCVLVAVGARAHWTEKDYLHYPANEVAARHGASVATETWDPSEAYADFPDGRLSGYQDGHL